MCYSCQLLICATCQESLDHSHVSPMGLMNDNRIGYLDPWIYETDITWMEKTVATPFWTG